MLLSVKARRTFRRKVTGHSAFSVLLRDQEWLGRAGRIVLTGTQAELPSRPAVLALLTELPSYWVVITEAEVDSKYYCVPRLISSLRCFTHTIAP